MHVVDMISNDAHISALPVQKTLLPVVLTNEENSVCECQVEITASMLLLMSTLPTINH